MSKPRRNVVHATKVKTEEPSIGGATSSLFTCFICLFKVICGVVMMFGKGNEYQHDIQMFSEHKLVTESQSIMTGRDL